MSSWVLKWHGSLMIALFRCVGSKQKHSFKLPNLSLLSISTKLLIQCVASCNGLSTPACLIYFLFKCFFKVDRNWGVRSLLMGNTWINLYLIWRTWEATNPFKDIRVFMQNLFFTCNQHGNMLGNCILLCWCLSGHFTCRSLSGHFLLLYIQCRFSFLGMIGWAFYQASSGWQIVQSCSWLYQPKHQSCFTR